MNRIENTFAGLQKNKQKAFVAYVMSGDPNYELSLDLIKGLPNSGVDIIELGLPFTDPMADGPIIQLAGQRALASGQTVNKTLKLVKEFRLTNKHTPIVIMGYY